MGAKNTSVYRPTSSAIHIITTWDKCLEAGILTVYRLRCVRGRTAYPQVFERRPSRSSKLSGGWTVTNCFCCCEGLDVARDDTPRPHSRVEWAVLYVRARVVLSGVTVVRERRSELCMPERRKSQKTVFGA